MILLTAIVAGLFAGLLKAGFQHRSWQLPELRYLWLVLVSFLPQFFAFYLPATRTYLADGWVAAGLVVSQIGLLVFCLLNGRLPGMKVLALGLLLNLLVIAANGGFMPMSTETATQLIPGQVLRGLTVGGRLGASSKDILLPPDGIVLPWLADRFLPPAWFPYRFAFSLGDVFVGLGAFLLLGLQPNWQKGIARHASQPDDQPTGDHSKDTTGTDRGEPAARGSADQQPVP